MIRTSLNSKKELLCFVHLLLALWVLDLQKLLGSCVHLYLRALSMLISRLKKIFLKYPLWV
eukprot:XP_001709645.1 Hypothetical protein GL50803_2554 [Giardia lamblia ATCC 50803]